MAPAAQREWLEAFIELYRSEPCLWKLKSPDYYNKSKKNEAYEKLITKLQEIEPTATRESVIKKINNIRCSYKKEYNKVIKSLSSSSETIYEPTLWYFHLLSFLDSQETMRISGSDLDKTFEINNLKLSDTVSGSGTDTEQTTVSEEEWSSRLIAAKVRESERNGSLSSTADDFMEWPSNASLQSEVKYAAPQPPWSPAQESKWDLVGKLVTVKMRTLSEEQASLADKIINDVLYYAEKGTLTMDHVAAVNGVRARPEPRLCALCESIVADLPVPVLEYNAVGFSHDERQ